MLSDRFAPYTAFDPKVPVRCVTGGRCIHRFFDTSPISPSGRYLAALRLPFEDRHPLPGERAQVVLVDLWEGVEQTLCETAGWEMQVGANLQWGATDGQLFFNDVDTKQWHPYGVCLDPFTGRRRLLEGCVFEVSKDGRFVATTDPVRARFSQQGYGVMIPDALVPRTAGPSETDGLFITDVETGRCRLLCSIRDIVQRLSAYFTPEAYPPDGEFFGFQCKWNREDSKLLMVLRWVSADGRRRKAHVLTLNRDGSDLRLCIPAEEWGKGGHHIAWHPDGEHLTMNLNLEGKGLRFIIVRYDGTGLRKLSEAIEGSGHPSVHASGQCLITDSYTKDYGARPDGTTPIRLISLTRDTQLELIRMRTATPYDSTLRLDPHPAWDRTHCLIAFNGYDGGTRRVYVADLRQALAEWGIKAPEGSATAPA